MIEIDKLPLTDSKHFYSFEVLSALNTLPQAIKNSDEYTYEQLAWSFNFSNEKCDWGTFNGPVFRGTNADGTSCENPNYDMITTNAIDYWNQQRNHVTKPIYILRYVSLVWDFWEKIKVGTKKPSDVYNQLMDSLLAVIEEDYLSHPTIVSVYFDIVFQLLGTNEPYKVKVLDLLETFVNQYSVENANIGIWCVQANMYLNHSRYFTKENATKVWSYLSDRYEYWLNQKKDIWIVKELAELLCEILHKQNNNEEILKVLNKYKDILNIQSDMSAMKREWVWKDMSNLYNKYGFREQANQVMLLVQQASKDSIKEMEKFEHSITIPNEQIEKWLKTMTQGTPEEQIDRFILRQIPNITDVENKLKEDAHKMPLLFMMPTQLYIGDKENPYPGSFINSLDTDIEGHTMTRIYQNAQTENLFIAILIKRLMETNVLTDDMICKQIDASPLLSDSRKEVMHEAIKLYFDEQFVLFCHLVVPQIEAMIRKMLDCSGITVIKPQKNKNGYQLKTLDDLLREPIIDTIFNFYQDNKSVSTYLRAILTDQRAMNYRNNLCHGLVNPQNFGREVANRILHVLLMILKVQETK